MRTSASSSRTESYGVVAAALLMPIEDTGTSDDEWPASLGGLWLRYLDDPGNQQLMERFEAGRRFWRPHGPRIAEQLRGGWSVHEVVRSVTV